MIIAAGVLNNTKNILETVNKLKHMLRDEGIFISNRTIGRTYRDNGFAGIYDA